MLPTLPDMVAKMLAATLLRRRGFGGFIAATNVFEEAAARILSAGCDATFNYLGDDALGLAKHSRDALNVSERAS